MSRINKIVVVLCLLFAGSINSASGQGKSPDSARLPNIILIMADDMGYECLSSNGSTEYNTPNLDKLAAQGMTFNNAFSQPLCTPSRVKIMTGLYNYRNYDFFGHLNTSQYTFGNLAKDAGYKTCIAGKWQLNGLGYKDSINDWDDNSKPHKLGFDEYSLWQLTKGREQGERYANPYIEQNGRIIETGKSDYGPDIFSEFILDFMEKNVDSSFLVYYPMVLPHGPFVPTPDSKDWHNAEFQYKRDTVYFKDMIKYIDKIVGKINEKIEQLGLAENTILMFTSDNGTHTSIITNTVNGPIRGGKGNTTDAGTHVPLIVSWPGKIKEGSFYDGLIEFSDFFPTIADIVQQDSTTDGRSFFALLNDEDYSPRETVFIHHDPRHTANANQYRGQFVRTIDYKLYSDGRFYNIAKDKLEHSPLTVDSLTEQEKMLKQMLQQELNKHPK